MLKEMGSVLTAGSASRIPVFAVAPPVLDFVDAPHEMITTEKSSAASNDNPVILRTLQPPVQ
jgi:hypothetical protein